VDSVSLALVGISLLVLLYALVSGRLSRSIVSAAMFFIAGGVLIGPSVLGWFDLSATSGTIETLAEATLALVLFSDASRIRVNRLRREHSIPVRLLAIGLPLTILAGMVVALLLLPSLLVAEALLLAVILAPTDAALGQAVVSDERLPPRVSQALNVESGLNDGICVPLLLISLAWADAESGALSASESLTVVLEAVGYGVLVGGIIGLCAALGLSKLKLLNWVTGTWAQLVPLAGAVLSFSLAEYLGGSGFIAAFVAGLTFGAFYDASDRVEQFVEEAGGLSNAATFIVLGAVLVVPHLEQIDLSVVIYAALSLTVVRMLPVALALLGSKARAQTVLFVGWFGPRGLASLVFIVAVLDTPGLPHGDVIVSAAVTTVLLSVVAHGVSAIPLTNRYAKWFGSMDEPMMEHEEVAVHRWRGQR
jgi:sodium/hydrogen antiporter